MSDQRTGFAEWAHLEAMGHRSHFGSVTEQVIAGTCFIRCDVFALGDEAPRETRLYGAGSIFCLTPCTEDQARLASTPYGDRPRAELAPVDDDEDDDDDDDFEPEPFGVPS